MKEPTIILISENLSEIKMEHLQICINILYVCIILSILLL